MNIQRDNIEHRELEPRLGIDIGRVIIAPSDPRAPQDTSFLGGTIADAVATPASEGAFDVITELVELFEGRVWLVSKAGKRVREKTHHWLAHHDFFATTGVPSNHLRFCYKRHEKAGHSEELGLTHFIDDRTQVLHHLRELVPHLYLFGPQKKEDAKKRWLTPALTWEDIAALLMPQEGQKHGV